VLGDQDLRAVDTLEAQRPVLHAQVDPLGAETVHQHRRDLGVLSRQEPRAALELGHPGAEAGEALGELAADRPPPSTRSRAGSSRIAHTVSEVR